MNLNLGCGPNRASLNVVDHDHSRWKFIDSFEAYKPDECYDFSLGIREPNESADRIFLGDALEHVVHWRTHKVLCECHRVLVKGGSLLVVVPDMGKVMPQFLATGEGIGLIWGHQDAQGGGNEWGDSHKTGFTEEVLFRELRKAGFYTMRRGSLHDVWYELAVEAVK